MFPTPIQRFIARILVASLVWTHCIAARAAVEIADLPLGVVNTVAPNVMFTLDDSGSMMFEVMPDDEMVANSNAVYTYPQGAGVYGSTPYTTFPVVDFDSANPRSQRLRSAAFNKVYYDPAVRYRPWLNSDGSSMANASTTAAYHNPRITAAGSRNLTVDNTETALWLNADGSTTNTAKTFWPATYTRYDSGSGTFTWVEIRSTTTSYAKAAGRTDCAAATCTYAEEIQNFANWYQYYRSRVLASRAGVGQAFATQGGGLWVGYATINQGNSTVDGVATKTIVKGVRDFTGADRTNWFSLLYDGVIDRKGTPLRRALDEVGTYFERSDNNGPWSESPGANLSTAHKECRASYNIFMTDGYWNGDGPNVASAKLNQDGLAGSTITGPNGESYTYNPANPFSDAFDQTLADVAMYYWKRDLRPTLGNRVPTSDTDPGFWQHLVTFTVGLGVFGTIPKADLEAALGSSPPTISWPQPVDATPTTKIDDLAHAAINSRGGFYSVSDPASFAQALKSALGEIISRAGAGSSLGVADPNITASNNRVYATSYSSADWTGDLNAYSVDATTGAVDTGTALWTSSSAAQLDAVPQTSRKIASYSGSSGIQFQPTTATTTTKLSNAQQTLLNTPSKTDGANVVNYLRGDRSGETGGTYRKRTHVLGDVVNADPLVVGAPSFRYADAGYASFKSSTASRATNVYVGANDGMLHAFDGGTGAERWSYVPSFVLPTLNLRTRTSGFEHRYYVDATPVTGDVDFNKTNGASGSPDWRTILVGGLGKGGKGFYAIDITDPAPGSEAAVAGKVLWEFPNASSGSGVVDAMGYSFGKPIIAKTDTYGWVVLVTSGYNNATAATCTTSWVWDLWPLFGHNQTTCTGGSGTGHGYLAVLNAKTGEMISYLETSAGDASNPSGLAQISAYAENSDVDNTIDFVYGGDLLGNLWRFDLRGASSTWTVKKLASLVDDSNNAQPITSAPELSKVKYLGAWKRLVHVGTGQYLGAKDIPGSSGAYASASSTQSFYTLLDNESTNPTISPLRSNLVEQTVTSAGVYTITQVNYGSGGKKGWYLDLPLTGERVVSEAAMAGNALVFTSILPSSDACKPGGASYFYRIDFASEQSRAFGPYITPLRVALGDTLATRPVLVKVGDTIKALVRKSDGTTSSQDVVVTGSAPTTRRLSWRELPER